MTFFQLKENRLSWVSYYWNTNWIWTALYFTISPWLWTECRENDSFSHTYFKNVPYEWNLLDQDTKNAQSISKFKRRLLAIIWPTRNSYCDILNIEGIKKLIRLRVEFSALNEHRFRHNFDCSSSACKCETGIVDNKHFLPHCKQYDLLRRDLFHQPTISVIDINGMDTKILWDLLLLGSNDLNLIQKRIIIEVKIFFIEARKRLDLLKRMKSAATLFIWYVLQASLVPNNKQCIYNLRQNDFQEKEKSLFCIFWRQTSLNFYCFLVKELHVPFKVGARWHYVLSYFGWHSKLYSVNLCF